MDISKIPKNKDLTYIGLTTFRDKNQLFGIKRKDRRQHVYLLGKSGTGKSVLMFNMIIQNIQNGEGVCVVDPHGELVEGVLSAIPPHRVKDVVYFNPADANHHIGFNVLELIDPQYKHLVASGLMGIFTKIWANAWSARMEYILNNAILALLDTPGSTMLGIPRMLVDKDYRQKIISNLKDPVIKAFWIHEYEAWQDKFRNEAIAPIQNKVGQFLSTSIIRNVVGQSKSTINIFDIMNEGKIFLVNVSKGRIGEDNSALLGGMIITKIQLAAMERVRIPEDERKDFYLYVDEFQNFVTDSFASILSEARKYRLNLTVAHQYTAQLVSDKSSAVRDAIFGNVGTMIVFRVGADDAEFLEKEFDPEFTPSDIVNLPNYKIYLKLMIDGITSRPFSAKTLPPMAQALGVEEDVIKSSRELYCRPKEVVEREINNWSGMSLGNDSDSGAMEKFKAVCSICQKETMVPFKPEPGRPVYCKECIAKMKSGELKPIKGSINQIKHDEAKFYKPLSDLGIEFENKDRKFNVDEEHRYDEHKNVKSDHEEQLKKPGIFTAIKKAFNKTAPKKNGNMPNRPMPSKNNFTGAKPPRPKIGENLALREILNKTLSDNKILEIKPIEQPKLEAEKIPVSGPEPISLNALKEKKVEPVASSLKDKSANSEEMNKLKAFIESSAYEPMSAPSPFPTVEEFTPEAIESIPESVAPVVEPVVIPKEELVQPTMETPTPAPSPTPPPVPQYKSIEKIETEQPTVEQPVQPSSNPVPQPAVREVPEHVLKKILE